MKRYESAMFLESGRAVPLETVFSDPRATENKKETRFFVNNSGHGPCTRRRPCYVIQHRSALYYITLCYAIALCIILYDILLFILSVVSYIMLY